MPNQIRASRQRYEDKYWWSGWTSPKLEAENRMAKDGKIKQRRGHPRENRETERAERAERNEAPLLSSASLHVLGL